MINLAGHYVTLKRWGDQKVHVNENGYMFGNGDHRIFGVRIVPPSAFDSGGGFTCIFEESDISSIDGVYLEPPTKSIRYKSKIISNVTAMKFTGEDRNVETIISWLGKIWFDRVEFNCIHFKNGNAAKVGDYIVYAYSKFYVYTSDYLHEYYNIED